MREEANFEELDIDIFACFWGLVSDICENGSEILASIKPQ
jgi:hypothetical protein